MFVRPSPRIHTEALSGPPIVRNNPNRLLDFFNRILRSPEQGSTSGSGSVTPIDRRSPAFEFFRGLGRRMTPSPFPSLTDHRISPNENRVSPAESLDILRVPSVSMDVGLPIEEEITDEAFNVFTSDLSRLQEQKSSILLRISTLSELSDCKLLEKDIKNLSAELQGLFADMNRQGFDGKSVLLEECRECLAHLRGYQRTCYVFKTIVDLKKKFPSGVTYESFQPIGLMEMSDFSVKQKKLQEKLQNQISYAEKEVIGEGQVIIKKLCNQALLELMKNEKKCFEHRFTQAISFLENDTQMMLKSCKKPQKCHLEMYTLAVELKDLRDRFDDLLSVSLHLQSEELKNSISEKCEGCLMALSEVRSEKELLPIAIQNRSRPLLNPPGMIDKRLLDAERVLQLLDSIKKVKDASEIISIELQPEEIVLEAKSSKFLSEFRGLIWQYNSPDGLVSYKKHPNQIDLGNGQSVQHFELWLKESEEKEKNLAKKTHIQSCLRSILDIKKTQVEIWRARTLPYGELIPEIKKMWPEILADFQVRLLSRKEKGLDSTELKKLIEVGERLKLLNYSRYPSSLCVEDCHEMESYIIKCAESLLLSFEEDTKKTLKKERQSRQSPVAISGYNPSPAPFIY